MLSKRRKKATQTIPGIMLSRQFFFLVICAFTTVMLLIVMQHQGIAWNKNPARASTERQINAGLDLNYKKQNFSSFQRESWAEDKGREIQNILKEEDKEDVNADLFQHNFEKDDDDEVKSQQDGLGDKVGKEFDNTQNEHRLVSNPFSYKKDVGKGAGTCNMPHVDPFDPSIRHLIEKYPPLDCRKGLPSVIITDGENLIVDPVKVKQKLSGKTIKHCRYRYHSLVPGGDFNITVSDWSQFFKERIKLQKGREHVLAECYGNTGTVVAKTYLPIVRVRPELEKAQQQRYQDHLKKNAPKETLSVMILGVDGMSKQNVARSMPKTKEFLTQTLNAKEMFNYNKNGMNTLPNVITLLTGKTVKEHSSYWNTEKHFDVIHFIWEDYEKAGYRTQVSLDSVKITSFHCSKQGFSKPPVHYYIRPTVIASEPDITVRHRANNCIGDTPEIATITDYQRQLAQRFNNTKDRPYFSYSFLVRLTHDNLHKASAGDELYRDYFKSLHDQKLLNNTVLIFFGDHGPRFGAIRRTIVGMFEDRMPFCFIVVPPWFLEKYPDVAQALTTNQHRLTSHFDIHATLKDILYFSGESGLGDTKSRSISLFKEIPEDRTCEQAGIDFQWCSCNKMETLDTNSLLVKFLAYDFAQKLSNKTLVARDRCHQLGLKNIKNALLVYPNPPRKGKGPDDKLYQVSIETTPGGGMFEVLLEFSKESNTAKIVSTVLRLNMFQTQSMCVEEAFLKPYCYCKNLGDS